MDEKEKFDIGQVNLRPIEKEMEESYLDYAMSVIVARALPDVRDGLKPVVRRILYAMNNMGLRHASKTTKSAKIVGEVLGKYHPHGDMAVYDALARLAQNFALRYLLIDGQGNFGSLDGDPPAAMRYCVTGDTLIPTDQGLFPIAEIANGKEDIKIKILSKNRNINTAVKWFDSGQHPTLKITTKMGLSLKGSFNHPLLVWTNTEKGPILKWKLLSQIQNGDVAVIDRTSDLLWPEKNVSLTSFYPDQRLRRTKKKTLPKELNEDLAYLLGALIAEGTIRQNKIEFCNSDSKWISDFENRWRKVFLIANFTNSIEKTSSFGKKPLIILEVHSRFVIEFLRNIGLFAVKSSYRIFPNLILQSPKPVVAEFLKSYFEGEGSISSR